MVGTRHRLPYPSVGATENLILAAVTARGTTVIENAAMEPEVVDLVLFLQKMGANIAVDIDRRIVIQGVERLGGATHRVIEDRIEIASYAAAAVATGGDIEVLGAQQEHLLTAGAFVAIVIPLMLFFALQRYFVRGLLAGSVEN